MTGLKRTPRSRGGFTLVELIVVLVILGVLATFAVPALTGYIDSAKEKQAVSEAQACVMTATRQGAQNYALVQNASVAGNAENAAALTNWAGPLEANAPEVTGGKVALTEGSGMYLLDVASPPAGSIATTTIAADAGVKGTVQGMTCNASGQVLYLVYTSADGIQVVYTNAGTTASVNIGSDEAVVVPTPKKNDSSGGGETGGGSTGGSTGGSISGGGTTGSTVTANEKQHIGQLLMDLLDAILGAGGAEGDLRSRQAAGHQGLAQGQGLIHAVESNDRNNADLVNTLQNRIHSNSPSLIVCGSPAQYAQ